MAKQEVNMKVYAEGLQDVNKNMCKVARGMKLCQTGES